jgi:hypothetical protein
MTLIHLGTSAFTAAGWKKRSIPPATVGQFRAICQEKGIEIPPVQLPMKLVAQTLFGT